MCSKYRTFRTWDSVDSEEYLFQSNDREIDDPGLNQDDSYEKDEEDFDDSDDFHKYDDTDENKETSEKSKNENSGRFDGTIGI